MRPLWLPLLLFFLAACVGAGDDPTSHQAEPTSPRDDASDEYENARKDASYSIQGNDTSSEIEVNTSCLSGPGNTMPNYTTKFILSKSEYNFEHYTPIKTCNVGYAGGISSPIFDHELCEHRTTEFAYNLCHTMDGSGDYKCCCPNHNCQMMAYEIVRLSNITAIHESCHEIVTYTNTNNTCMIGKWKYTQNENILISKPMLFTKSFIECKSNEVCGLRADYTQMTYTFGCFEKPLRSTLELDSCRRGPVMKRVPRPRNIDNERVEAPTVDSGANGNTDGQDTEIGNDEPDTNAETSNGQDDDDDDDPLEPLDDEYLDADDIPLDEEDIALPVTDGVNPIKFKKRRKRSATVSEMVYVPNLHSYKRRIFHKGGYVNIDEFCCFGDLCNIHIFLNYLIPLISKDPAAFANAHRGDTIEANSTVTVVADHISYTERKYNEKYWVTYKTDRWIRHNLSPYYALFIGIYTVFIVWYYKKTDPVTVRALREAQEEFDQMVAAGVFDKFE